MSKPDFTLLHPEGLAALAEVTAYGNKKYSPGDWITNGVGVDDHIAAALRHVYEYLWEDGKDESGLSNLAHAADRLFKAATLERINKAKLEPTPVDRSKEQCSSCQGSGEIRVMDELTRGGDILVYCESCKGTGKPKSTL